MKLVLRAIEDAYRKQGDGGRVLILTDSTYVEEQINEWKQNRWRREMRNGVLYNRTGGRLANQDLITSILNVFDRMNAEILYIPREQNTIADGLAKSVKNEEIRRSNYPNQN